MIVNPQKTQIAAYTGPAANHTELHLLSENAPLPIRKKDEVTL